MNELEEDPLLGDRGTSKDTCVQDKLLFTWLQRMDHFDVVKLFLKYRHDLSSLDNVEGATCFSIAAAKGSVTVIQELLTFSQGGLLRNKTSSVGTKVNSSSPLHLAASGGHTEVVMALLEAGASATEENLVRSLNLNTSTQYYNTVQMPKQHYSTTQTRI
ncbi:caskin-1-like [Tachysurus vachellii]|uniref:caskin-1-like n=1 Tax=Tachysurus vachellii TaxID=175792 RepID=UPI00296ACFCD|nr:caskin-1-like [Tachysurus vachellii]